MRKVMANVLSTFLHSVVTSCIGKQSGSFLVAMVLAGALGGCSREQPSPGGKPYEVKCREPLPVFTLGEKSNPTKAQETALCTCIWNGLGSWEREVSEKIAARKESEVSEMQLRAFSSRFGGALEKCGGIQL